MSDKYKLSKIYRSLQHGESLVKELHTQFKEGRNCDLEIRLNTKRLYVHKCLIDTFFLKAGAELEDDRFYLDLSRYSQPVVEALIGLVYTGNLRCAMDQVENVYKAAAELGFVEAQTGCMTYLRGNGIPVVLNEAVSPSPETVLPEPFPVENPADADPNVVIKTEPVDDVEETVIDRTTQPVKQTDYRSTILVPVSSQSLGDGLKSGQSLGTGEQIIHYNLDTQVNFGSFKTSSSLNKVPNAKAYPSLPAPKITRPLQKKATIEYVYPRKSDDTNSPTNRNPKKGRPPKVACLEKRIVDKIRNLSEQSHNSDSNSDARKKEPENKLGKVLPEKHNSSAATATDDALKKDNKLVEYQTKSGTIYYKYADPSSLSNDEFSVDSDSNVADTSESMSSTANANEILNSVKQSSQQSWMERVSTIVKTENVECDNIQGISASEDDKEAQKKEQMFSLGLTMTVDKGSASKEGIGSENPLKRKLRARKKVDYLKESIEHSGDFDEDSDNNPCEYPKKRPKANTTLKGKSLKIDSSSLLNIKDKKVIVEKQEHGSKTIAVRQDLRNIDTNDDDVYEETAYFPPAGSVPEGVRSRYAQGKFMKVRYVTESIKDSQGNITVVTKPVPVRPRQFGIDERLMNRPAVYVCHPTAPVVKQVVRKQTW